MFEVSDHHHHGSAGWYKNLEISGNANGVDTNGDPAEVKMNNSVHWGTKVMFQMISGTLVLIIFPYMDKWTRAHVIG
jgi:hypothetical protein